jgi:predicted NUDIX family NTP pyrophosphohydrolase
MTQLSAGILIYRRQDSELQVLLVHPGGPFWRNKDVGAWQIQKGLVEPGEDTAAAARREAEEELGVPLAGQLHSLGRLRQKGGKLVEAFALERDLDSGAIESNRFDLEWPPRSGKTQSFPEVDAARWFALDAAREMMLESQVPLLDRLLKHVELAHG